MQNPTYNNKIWKRISGLITVLVFVSVFAACDSNRPKDPYISVPDKGVTVENVVIKPDAYIDKQVTVAGTIKETFGERAFMIRGEKLVDELLVVGADPYPNLSNQVGSVPLSTVEAVRATGVIIKFNVAEIEREIGVNLNDSRLANYAGKPTLIVKSLERVKP